MPKVRNKKTGKVQDVNPFIYSNDFLLKKNDYERVEGEPEAPKTSETIAPPSKKNAGPVVEEDETSGIVKESANSVENQVISYVASNRLASVDIDWIELSEVVNELFKTEYTWQALKAMCEK